MKNIFNKTEYKMKDDCNTLLSADDCVSFNLLSIGLADSYIGEYSVFAVIGTGIRLSEEQIESFNGIDD